MFAFAISINSILFALVVPTLLVSAHPSPLHKRVQANVYSSCVNDKTVALTFDDGPFEYLEQISDELTRAGAKGTFFFNGNNFDCIYSDASISRVKYAYNAGHQVGSHTWSHGDLNTFNSDQINDAMYRMEEALERIVGVKPAFMRPPFGHYNSNVTTIATSRGQSLAIWDWDAGDADGNTTSQAEAVYQDAVNSKAKTMLVLNHETQKSTADSVIPYAINLLQKNGYKASLVTLAECLGMQPYQSISSPQQKSSQWTCNGTPSPGKACIGSQCKTGTPPTSTGHAIHPGKSSTTCLTASANTNRASVVVEPCKNSASQSWTWVGGTLTIYGNKCLDVTNGSTANGNKVQIYSCKIGNKNQQFVATSNNRITWTNTNECLDLTGGSTSSGNQVQMWKCSTGNINQLWNFA